MASTYTTCVLGVDNTISNSVSLIQNRYWQGYGDPPIDIGVHDPPPPSPSTFQHTADCIGSIGCLAYRIDPLTWIVAWSNESGKPNKVYTKILGPSEDIDWSQIEAILAESGTRSADIHQGYNVQAVIEPAECDTPIMTATLSPYKAT